MSELFTHIFIPGRQAESAQPVRARYPELKRRLLSLTRCLTALVVSFSPAIRTRAQVPENWTDVRDYFPQGWEEHDKLDLRDYIQQAVTENRWVYFPGSNDAGNPIIYHASTSIDVPAYRRLQFGDNHRVVRLPSAGTLFRLADYVHLEGAVIDGNKYAHWPEFVDLGKGDAGILIRNHCLLEDVVIFNNPGIGFNVRGDYNRFHRCRTENTGYIDVRFGYLPRMSYAGRFDRWSGDGFYMRGSHNLFKDCEAWDMHRSGFVVGHRDDTGNIFKNCRGGMVEFGSRMFLTIVGGENAVPSYHQVVNCKSPNREIHIRRTRYALIENSIATNINVNDSHAPMVIGNICGFLNLGMNQQVGVQTVSSPVVLNNRIYKDDTGSFRRSNWSFTVHSDDHIGLVAGNRLYEYRRGRERGPGQDFRGVLERDNEVIYGRSGDFLDNLPEGREMPIPELKYGYFEPPEEREYREEHRLDF